MRDIFYYIERGEPYEKHMCPYCCGNVYKLVHRGGLLSNEPSTLKCHWCGKKFEYGFSTQIQ